MKVLIAFIVLILSSQPVKAEESVIKQTKLIPLCAMKNAFKLKDEVLSYQKSDKFAHCALSCMLALRCGASQSLQVGYFKEMWDLVGPGKAELLDLVANYKGVRIALKQSVRDDHACIDECSEIYD